MNRYPNVDRALHQLDRHRSGTPSTWEAQARSRSPLGGVTAAEGDGELSGRAAPVHRGRTQGPTEAVDSFGTENR